MGKSNKGITETKTEKATKNSSQEVFRPTTAVKTKEEPRRNDLKNTHKSTNQQIVAKDDKVSSNQHKKEVENSNKKKKAPVKPVEEESSSESESDSIPGFDEEDINEEVQTSIKKVYLEKLTAVEAKLNNVLSEEQVKKAIDSLKTLLDKHFEKSFDIFARKEEEMLQVNFTFTTLPLKYSPRPVTIPVKLHTSVVRKVCLIIKDKFVQTWKDLNLEFTDKSNKFELDVIPFSSLKQEYALYEKKRNLVKQYDLFLCDKSLYMMLRKVLGKAFYNAKKYPLALTFVNSNPNEKLEKEEKTVDKKEAERIKQDIINAATNATFYMSNGPNYTVKAAYLNEEKTDKLVSKVLTAIKHTLAHIMKWGVEFDGLKTISLKFTNSLELPVFNQLTDDEIKAYYGKIEEKEKHDKKNKSDKKDKAEKKEKEKEKEKAEKVEKTEKSEKVEKKASKELTTKEVKRDNRHKDSDAEKERDRSRDAVKVLSKEKEVTKKDNKKDNHEKNGKQEKLSKNK